MKNLAAFIPAFYTVGWTLVVQPSFEPGIDAGKFQAHTQRMAKKTAAKLWGGARPSAPSSLAGDWKPVKPAKIRTVSNFSRDHLIYIPEAARKIRLMTFPISTPTLHFLHYNNCWVTGDLHGRTVLEIRKMRWCDQGTIAELRFLLQSVKQSHPLSTSEIAGLRKRGRPRVLTRRRAARKPRPAGLSVPENIGALNPFDLPLSVRLEKTLRRLELLRLARIFHSGI